MMRPLIIDNFAGGGGASTGIEAATGRAVDVAVNHDEAAVAVHAANHPSTKHYCQSILALDPLDATGGAPVALAWFSPDCKHHSKAKGGKPRDRNIRDLAWVVVHWIERLQRRTPNGEGAPQVIMLENVEEFRHWGPLDADGMPIKERRGEEFKLWITRIRRLGYKVEHRELRACDYGTPTSRKRLFLIARRDGRPIVWPVPTHGKPGTPGVVSGKLLPWRTAAECIDWSIPCPSIFDRKRPLKDATCKRIAAGVMRYVVNSARPFIVPVTHAGGAARVYDVDAPIPTVTGAHRGEMAAVVPHVMTMRNAGKPFTAADEPTHTITAEGAHQTVVTAHLTHFYTSNTRGGEGDPTKPMKTVNAGGQHHAVAAATLVSVDNTSTRASRSFDPQDPLRTVTATGGGYGAVAATLVQTGYSERPAQYECQSCGNGPFAWPYTGADHWEGSADCPRCGSLDVKVFAPPQAPRSLDIDAPLGTIVAGGAKHAAVSAFLAQHNTERGDRVNPGQPADKPISTITGRGTQQQVVETALIERDALPPAMLDSAVRVAAFLIKYYGSEIDGHGLTEPIGTVTTRERFAVVTVTIDAVTYVIVDIGMRMLEPRELANAQGFPPDYILAPVCWYLTDGGARKYGPLPKSHQIAKIGNSVCPQMSEALVRANLPELCVPAASERVAA